MRSCGNSNCMNFGHSWDTNHHSNCPYCPKELMTYKCTGFDCEFETTIASQYRLHRAYVHKKYLSRGA